MLIKKPMKQYVIDELRLEDATAVRKYLDEHFGPAAMGTIYWIPVPEEILSDVQKAHVDCQPYWFAVDLDETRLACEFLVRTKGSIRCHCIAYATAEQKAWLMDQTDAIFEKLNIIT